MRRSVTPCGTRLGRWLALGRGGASLVAEVRVGVVGIVSVWDLSPKKGDVVVEVGVVKVPVVARSCVNVAVKAEGATMQVVLDVVRHGLEEYRQVLVWMHVYVVPEKRDVAPSGADPMHARAQDAHHGGDGGGVFHVLRLELKRGGSFPVDTRGLADRLVGRERDASC